MYDSLVTIDPSRTFNPSGLVESANSWSDHFLHQTAKSLHKQEEADPKGLHRIEIRRKDEDKKTNQQSRERDPCLSFQETVVHEC